MTIDNNKYQLKRYDLSEDKSLKPWSASDELVLQAFNELETHPKQISIYHDRFGFLACHLNQFTPTIISNLRSQEKAIESNFKDNKLPVPSFASLLSPLENKAEVILLKIPKSLELFQLFLEHIATNSTDEVTVICGFMTRHFTPNMLKLAEKYFEVVTQSKAQKKARLITLTQKKSINENPIKTSITYNDQVYQQYLGVFSSDHIDYATQFFLENIEIDDSEQKILDLASGNGIIANEIYKQLPDAEIHLMDDCQLAVASAKMNISGKNIQHHYDNDLSPFEENSFDLIVTNPPFHFEHEINIQIALTLFTQCYRALKTGRNLQVVANQHLNYKVHLAKIFSSVTILAEDKKFVIYKCVK